MEADGIKADRIEAVYRKRRMVPFIERVPLTGAGLAAGDSAAPIPLRTGRTFGVLVCFESAFPELARDYRAAGAEFLVNITNDGWYGRDAWWGRTTALWQHPAHLVLRALETRMGVVRAANTGFSLFVDPLGRVYRQTALFQPTAGLGLVYTTDEVTLYVRWGDWVGWLVVVLGAGLLLAATARRDGAPNA